MAEQELVKHSRKIYKLWKSPGSLSHKIIEFGMEIIVIVFAISFSLLLERWRENQHDRHLEKEFLTDLRVDIIDKMKELEGDNTVFAAITHKLAYLYKTGRNEISFNKDSVEQYMSQAMNSYFLLTPNNAIFESMKSSGKFSVIRNKKLRIGIIKLYQQDLPTLQTIMLQFYYPSLDKFKECITRNKISKNKIDNMTELLMTRHELDNLLENMDDAYKKVAAGYNGIIKTNYQLLAQIEEELK